MRHARFLIHAIACGALVSCGQSFAEPEEAVRVFLTRLSAGDVDGARACVTSDEQAFVQLRPPTRPVSYDVGRARAKGEHARVPVTVNEGATRTETFWIVSREDGGWRVSVGMTVAQSNLESVQKEMRELGDDASLEEQAEALRRGMQNASPGR